MLRLASRLAEEDVVVVVPNSGRGGKGTLIRVRKSRWEKAALAADQIETSGG